MKTILVVSDTHGNVSALEAVLKWAKRLQPPGAVEAAVFLGDGIRDISPAEAAAGFSCKWKTIRGNNDSVFSMPGTPPEAALFDFCGHRFFLCHGHRYSLYSGFHTLTAAARSTEADAAFFGHTHVPHCENTDGVLLINPGSIGRPRSRIGATFAFIECTEGKPLQPHFWRIGPNGVIQEIRVF